ncbi:MAG: MBL fold metallo-hydrolase [Prevotella sp.]|nr:MBL fold metallo-hydrolase [Prevotella sp.]
MESITMLGTGNALVKHIYNTCFVIDDGQARLLVDAGGGNGILTQLDRAGIDIGSLHDIYVTHAHTDHILGVIWVVRLFIQMHLAGKAGGTLTVRSHQKVLDVLDYNLHAMLTARQYGEIGKTVQFCLTDDGSTFSVGGSHYRAFDIHSTKERQLGFSCLLPSGKRLVCLGDEPYNELNRAEAEHADWLMAEAFCLYADRERFHPYEKHHSTVRDAAALAQELGAKNLILYHTEEATLATRRQCYTAEAQQFFDGNVVVPDDLEVIRL